MSANTEFLCDVCGVFFHNVKNSEQILTHCKRSYRCSADTNKNISTVEPVLSDTPTFSKKSVVNDRLLFKVGLFSIDY